MASTIMKIMKPSFISQMARNINTSNVNEKAWNILKLNHVAIATPDLGKAAVLFKDILGMETSDAVPQPEHGVYTRFVACGNTNLELLSVYGDKSPIDAFLKKNSSGGMHHICLEVDNIKAAVEDLKKNNIRLLSEETKIGAHGQFICGEKRCNEKEKLRSWEVNFAYFEDSEKKNALVKLRLCPNCSYKLNYHYQRKEIKKPQKKRTLEEKSEEEKGSKKVRQEDNPKEGNEEATSKQDEASCSSHSESSDIWKGKDAEEKSKEEEFEDYLNDMLL